MSLKKILILPVGFILIHALYTSCCKCVEGNFFREVSSLRVSHYSALPFTNTDTVYVADTLTSLIQLNFNYITKVKANPFNSFVNTAYATHCNCSNFSDSGYKYRIDSIVITSNIAFNGIAAGTNLVAFFKGLSGGNGTSINYVPVRQLLDSFYTAKYYDNINLICPVIPSVNKTHSFNYKLYSNGKPFEAAGRKIVKWQ